MGEIRITIKLLNTKVEFGAESLLGGELDSMSLTGLASEEGGSLGVWGFRLAV